MQKERLVLIDGNSIINRAYFALPPLNDTEGRNVNAVYGFVNILFKVVADYAPDKLIVTFDKRGKNFRKEIYQGYKATRKGMPDDLAAQMPMLHELLDVMHVTVVEKEGVEADDIIGTLAKRFALETLAVTGDKDLLQLVDDDITVLLTKKGVTEVERVDKKALLDTYGLTPEQVIEYKALRGDTSDNIPGVRGIGEKTASALLSQYGNVDNIYAHLDEIKGAVKEKLSADKDMAYVSKALATIVTDADVNCDINTCFPPMLDGAVRAAFERLQFRSLLSRLKFNIEEEATESARAVETLEVDDRQKLADLVEEMSHSAFFAFHYDKDMYFSSRADVQYRIRISDSFLDGLDAETVFNAVGGLLSGEIPKAVYDWKALRHVLNGENTELLYVKYDVSLMQYLVEYRAYKDFSGLLAAYGYKDTAAGIFALSSILDRRIKESGTAELYYNVELPLSDLLYRMETEGVSVDVEALDAMACEFRERLEKLAEAIYADVGERFNIASPKQLSTVLFDKLNLKRFKKNTTGYSTDNEVLEKLQYEHPVVCKIIEYRKISKILGTYLDGLKPLVKRGVVHTTYNQSLTSTGRLSSSDPNLQNIPVRNEMGKEIRKLFVSKHGIFVGADYSQIELRLLAAFSGDENLLNAFSDGEDIHRKVASELMGIPAELVNSDMRRMAKAVNFGIIYGISDFGLSQNTGISVKKAHEYIALYFSRFPKIKSYLEKGVAEAREKGYVTTLTGRRRQIPEIKSSNFNLRNFGERAAMNMPLQGSAADIMKIAMLKVDCRIREMGLKSKIVMQVHDELIIDAYQSEADTVKKILKEEMEHAVLLACPLTVDLEEGKNLYEA